MARTQWIFGSPVLQLQYPAAAKLNSELERLILRWETRKQGVKQSNRGGWQSEKNLQTIKSPAVRRLLAFIDLATRRVMLEVIPGKRDSKIRRDWKVIAWANVNRQMDFNSLHYHVGSFWSGVYYVSTPPGLATNEGIISFRTPTLSPMLASIISAPAELRQAFQHNVGFKPTPGMLLMFPSWLEHSVFPHSRAGERISIGFDVQYS